MAPVICSPCLQEHRFPTPAVVQIVAGFSFSRNGSEPSPSAAFADAVAKIGLPNEHAHGLCAGHLAYYHDLGIYPVDGSAVASTLLSARMLMMQLPVPVGAE